MKFKSKNEDQVNGSNLCMDIFGSNATTRHKEFKVFFSATDPLIPTPPKTTHPNWKIDPVLKHMMRVSKEAMMLGNSISIDEQDIGFQGQHKDKQQISSSELVMDFWLMLFVLMDTPLVGTFVTKLLPKCGQAKDYLLFIVE